MMENRQGDRKGTPVPYTKWLYKGSRVWYGRTLAVALVYSTIQVFVYGTGLLGRKPPWQQHVYRDNNILYLTILFCFPLGKRGGSISKKLW